MHPEYNSPVNVLLWRLHTVHEVHGDSEVQMIVSWQPNVRNACSLYTESPDYLG